MSAFLAVASSVVQAVASATPAVTATPVATPVVTPAPGLLDTVNHFASHVSQTDMIAVASALAVTLQALLNKVPFFRHVIEYVQDVRRFVLAVLVPVVLSLSASLATGQNELHLAPVVFLGAQILFYAGKFLAGKALAALASKPMTVTNASTLPVSSTTSAVTFIDPTAQF